MLSPGVRPGPAGNDAATVASTLTPHTSPCRPTEAESDFDFITFVARSAVGRSDKTSASTTASRHRFARSAIKPQRIHPRLRNSHNPVACHGEACVQGTRVLMTVVLDAPTAGTDTDEIVDHYPTLTVEGVRGHRDSPRATPVADPFHMVRHANTKVNECPRRVDNETLGITRISDTVAESATQGLFSMSAHNGNLTCK